MEVENDLERCMVRRDELDLSLWIVLEEVIHICDASPKVTWLLESKKGLEGETPSWSHGYIVGKTEKNIYALICAHKCV